MSNEAKNFEDWLNDAHYFMCFYSLPFIGVVYGYYAFSGYEKKLLLPYADFAMCVIVFTLLGRWSIEWIAEKIKS